MAVLKSLMGSQPPYPSLVRPQILQVFSRWTPHQSVRLLPQEEVLGLYRRAVFVPCGNDNSGIGMDVSRIQEVCDSHVWLYVTVQQLGVLASSELISLHVLSLL